MGRRKIGHQSVAQQADKSALQSLSLPGPTLVFTGKQPPPPLLPSPLPPPPPPTPGKGVPPLGRVALSSLWPAPLTASSCAGLPPSCTEELLWGPFIVSPGAQFDLPWPPPPLPPPLPPVTPLSMRRPSSEPITQRSLGETFPF